MTLSDQFCGGAEPLLSHREDWEQWFQQQHPDLRPAELRKEWSDRMSEATLLSKRLNQARIEEINLLGIIGMIYPPWNVSPFL